MNKLLKIIFVGFGSIFGLGLLAGFAFLPSVFDAKYTGPVLTTSDGKELVTIVRLPEGEGPFPTLIVRSPYTLPHTTLSGMPSEDLSSVADRDLVNVGWAPVTEAGYALVIQHTRGRVGSQGIALSLKDREDALELLEWVKRQPWSNGKIGTTGDSIEGILAMITNSENPEGVYASYVQIGTPNLINEVMLGPGGALKLETFLPWMAENILTADSTHFEELGFGPLERRASIISMGLKMREILSDLDRPHTLNVWNHLPIKDYPSFSDASPSWNALLAARPDSDFAAHFDATKTRVPTYYVAAWFDVFASSQISSFMRSEKLGVDQRLLILNGTHFTPENPGAWPIQPMLPWFNYYLKGEESDLLEMPRVVFPIANGDDEWFGAETWPPVATSLHHWELSSDGRIVEIGSQEHAQNLQGLEDSDSAESELEVQGGARSYIYDPRDPVPTIGGRNLLITNGALDQKGVREKFRPDVLSYDSKTLSSPILVVGQITANLAISSSAPDTDFTVKIMDLAPDGSATLVSEGIQRARFRQGLDKQVFLKDGEIYQLQIDLGHIAWRFRAGHKIAVDVSSSNFPQWDRNLNTGAAMFSSTDMQAAKNSVHHGRELGSHIELPVIEDTLSLEKLVGLTTSVDEE